MTIARAQMNRQLYQLGGPIEEARSFYTNNLGMDPQEADVVLGRALNTYSQNMQPQNMMQMASNGGRIGYQMGGGIESMPMNFGQPLQVPPMSNPSFSPMQSMPSNPMLNYGQTPLTMNRGGIARLGYEAGGVTLPSQGSELEQANQMDPEKALQIIVQILIENGIPSEQAQQLAQQLLQVFLQGGEPALEQFANQLEQEEQASSQGIEQLSGMQEEPMMMAGGGIADYARRQGYGFGGIGKIFKGAAKAVSGVVKGVAGAVKSVVKSDIGKLALAAAAIYAGGGGFGLSPGGFSFFGSAAGPGLLGGTGTLNLGSSVIGQGLFGAPALGDALVSGSKGLFGNLGLSAGYGSSLGTSTGIGGTIGKFIGSPASTVMSLAGGDKGNLLSTLGVGGIGAALGGLLGPKKDDETDEQYQSRLQTAGPYLKEYYTNLNPSATPDQVNEFVRLNTSEYGGLGTGNTFAKGGSIVPPVRQIEGGIMEVDARKSGGYIPYGKKERVDDVPAMLAKDEFVFTSRAVKAAGGGSAKRGAAKMYALMKQLEGARA